MEIKVKRIYDDPSPEDGYRMLVDRLWPRGMKKEDAAIDAWNKAVSPSTELRKWFHNNKEKFDEFSELYKEELREKQDEIDKIRNIASENTLTFLYAAKTREINHAQVLREYVLNKG